MKILNLYAGIGGNRRNWKNCDVTAIEYNGDIAMVYRTLYPEDKVIIDDAHEYLRQHFKEYDFIWASPPCQTHSSFRQNIGVRFRGVQAVYPDMKLYEEILFLQYNAKCKWVVENVTPYYEPLIESTVKLDRHLFWTNFDVHHKVFEKAKLRAAQIPELQEYHQVDLSQFKLPNKRQILRNCVSAEVGEYLLNQSQGVEIKRQDDLFPLDKPPAS